MSDEDAVFTQGAIAFPLPLASATGNSLLRDADPAVWRALDFFASVLRIHLSDRFDEAAAAAGLDSEDVVAQALPYDPKPYFSRQQFKFPLLAIYRTRERIGAQSVLNDKTSSSVIVQWSLPPLDAAQAEQLTPFLHAVGAVVRFHAWNNSHPDYESGLLAWDSVKVARGQALAITYGNMQGVDGNEFPTAHIELELVERDMPTTGAYEAMTGVTGTIDMADTESATIETIAEIDIEPDGS